MRLIFSFFVILLLASCKKDKLEFNLSSFWQCNQSQNFNAVGVANKLMGAWVLSKRSCSGEVENILADKTVKAVFNSDFTFSVSQGSSILTQGTWKIVQIDGSSWGLNLSSASQYLDGRILFCDNQVVFNNSYIGTCDHLFTKGS